MLIFPNFISYYIFLYIFLINSCMCKVLHVEKRCWIENGITGVLRGRLYQIVYVQEGRVADMECRKCNDSYPIEADVKWGQYILNNTDLKYIELNTESKALRKKMDISEDQSLLIKKAKKKNSGMYNCFVNDTINNLNYNITYMLEISDKKASIENGTITEWTMYYDGSIKPLIAKLEEESLNDEIMNLEYSWDNWSKCICGVKLYNTRRYRVGHCYVKINDNINNTNLFNNSLLLPCKSEYLTNNYKFCADLVKNVSDFKEYEHCFDECVPGVIDNDDVDYKYSQSLYLSQGTHTKLICTNASTEDPEGVQWLKNDLIYLNKTMNSLGTHKKEKHVSVDMMGILHLIDIKPNDNGQYSCLYFSKPIRRFNIIVVPKSIIMTNEGRASLALLTYILLLFFIIYWIIIITKIRVTKLDDTEHARLI